MRERQPIPDFPQYFREAIARRGFSTATEFAREAGIHPSVALRWANGDIRPSVPLLERAAPVLGAKLSTLIRIAYPEVDEGLPLDNGEELHPLAAELNRRLGPHSTLPEGEQEILSRLVDSLLSKYRSRPSPKANH